MKPIDQLSGVERAAALLVSLGRDVAAEILKHLDEASIERLTAEMARIDRLSPAEREDLIGGFLIDLRKEKKRVRGGQETARELLAGAFGTERAEEVMARSGSVDFKKEFQYLAEVPDEVLLGFIRDEHPQTIAVVLSYLPPEKSAVLLKGLPPETGKQVVIRMAKMERAAPEAVVRIAKTLRKKYDHYQKEGQGLTSGGMNSLIEILGHMSGDDERTILATLDTTLPGISQQIREQMFSFDNILHLSNKEVRILIDEVGDDDLIARALKGAGDDLRFKFLRNMSQNRATDIIQEMEALGAVRLSEVEDYRGKIVAVMRALHENGVISVKTGSDVVV